MNDLDLRELVTAYRNGDLNAYAGLYEYVTTKAHQIARHYNSSQFQDAADDASLHVLDKLKSTAFDPTRSLSEAAVKKWIEQATKNYLRTQCRKKGTTAIPLSALANEASDGDGGNFEIADKKLPPDKETIDRLQRCVDAFENIHQLIEQGLEVLVKAVDFRAVYLWLFRTELYRVARCEYGSSPDWYSCLTLVEDCCSWAGNRGGLKFRQGWPPIGKLWELLRAHRERAENLDVSLVVVVAKKTHPDLNAKPCQLYQWFRRLRNHIMAEFTEDKLLAAAGSREHLQAWQNIIMCSEDR